MKDITGKYLVRNNTRSGGVDAVYDLIYNKDGSVIVMKFSDLDKSWTQPGKTAASLKDTGNGLRLVFNQGPGNEETRLFLNYSDASELRAMLNINHRLYSKTRGAVTTQWKVMGGLSKGGKAALLGKTWLGRLPDSAISDKLSAVTSKGIVAMNKGDRVGFITPESGTYRREPNPNRKWYNALWQPKYVYSEVLRDE